MRNFINNILLFIIILLVLFFVGVFLPATPKASKSNLFAKLDKDSLLKNTATPRIIFIGGSNLSFGINSRIIKDSLDLNPINTSIHATIGLVYMLDNTIDLIRSGDIVVISPEYTHFYGKFAYGGKELLRTVFDVSLESINTLRSNQWFNIYRYLLKYAFSKFDIREYLLKKETQIGLYERMSFNKFGDVYTHWKLENEKFFPWEQIKGEFNYDVLDILLDFKSRVQEKGAILYITFPCFQAASFENSLTQIRKVEIELKKKGFSILGTPEQYKMPDDLMFNTPYHLNKGGLDLRTRLLIDDLKKQERAKNGFVNWKTGF